TLFISDLHLEAARPEIGSQFLEFLQREATGADALYILGDLFDSWIGDDDPEPGFGEMKKALRSIVDGGVPVYFMHGNRDFLIGRKFADETGIRLLEDPCKANFYGREVLLSHGDALCIDDVRYQEVRLMTRDPAWQALMLRKPLEERQAIARQARADSAAHTATLDRDISDVNQGAVEALMRRYDVRTLLHGHTHRPAVHSFPLDGEPATRIVLGDWYEQGSVVRWDQDGFRLEALPRP
ncbi:MAG: UDP-2,3-diacylglucosamine diphosphatase, partial [Woeseia sp.]